MSLMCLVQVTACLLSELATDSRAYDEIQGNVQADTEVKMPHI